MLLRPGRGAVHALVYEFTDLDILVIEKKIGSRRPARIHTNTIHSLNTSSRACVVVVHQSAAQRSNDDS